MLPGLPLARLKAACRTPCNSFSFQIDQTTSSSRELNRGREAESIRRRWRNHHSPTSLSLPGIRDAKCSGWSIANQPCLVNTHPRNRCPPVSGSWLHNAHSSLSWSPCCFLRSEVQSRRMQRKPKEKLDARRSLDAPKFLGS
jgi:hypothetical protein